MTKSTRTAYTVTGCALSFTWTWLCASSAIPSPTPRLAVRLQRVGGAAQLLRVAALAGGLQRGNERGGVVQERVDDLYEEVLAAELPEAVHGARLESRAVFPCSADVQRSPVAEPNGRERHHRS
jgi:hypothetical protein